MSAAIEIENYRALDWGDDLDARLKERMSCGHTGWIDGQPIMSAGVITYWRGCGTLWMVVHDQALFLKHIKKALPFCKVAVNAWAKQFRRLEVCVPCHAPNQNWIKHLGFEAAQLKEKYGPNGENFIEYVRLEK
jgi:hypothetical protein